MTPVHDRCEASLQLRIDPPLSGAENMAVDNDLLQAAVQGIASLRFYQWIEPTISLGHFQAAVPSGPLAALPSVRRLSGGGAILHDRELTYSCALPATHPVCRNPGDLYDAVHEVIRETLNGFGIESRLRGTGDPQNLAFLCYARGDARDLVIGAHKIVGSAQRRRQGAVLQHGSLLLQASPWTPQFPGIHELTGVSLTANDLIPQLAERIPEKLTLQTSTRDEA